MKVIVCGAGRVGSTIARYLAQDDNEVVVIDTNADRLADLETSLDIQTITGFSSYPSVLERANAAAAEHLEPEIPRGDFCAAAAAAPALHEKAQTRDKLGRRQRAPARGAVTVSLDHALSARQTPDHDAEKAEYARAEGEAQQP